MNTTQTTAGDGQERPLQHAADRLKDEGRRIAGDVRAEAERTARRGTDAAARYLQDIGEAATTASGELRDKGHGATADLFDTTAGELSHLGRNLGGRDIGDLVDDLQDFAQRRPVLFFGASLLAGFAAMRFLEASSPYDGDDGGTHDGATQSG